MSHAIDLTLVIFFALVLIVTLVHLFQEFTGRAPFIPISSRMIPDIADALRLREGSVLYDLGSGDGRVSRALANMYSETKVVGIERSFVPFILSKLFSYRNPRPNLSFIRSDFFKMSFADATHIYLYLFPGVMPDLLITLQSELRPGTRVVSCDFTFPGKEPKEVIDLSETHRSKYKLYVYEF